MRIQADFPTAIDINPTAKCNLHCSFCWGPDHMIKDGLTTLQWKKVISFFANHGTKAVVFTGGEPLLRIDLAEIAKFAKNKSMHTTLSTNTILLLTRGKTVLPYIDEIGIPLDGSTKEMNSRMRLGNFDHFTSSINALHFTKNNFPNIHITIRTVVSNVNKTDINNIGRLLLHYTDKFDRWKIYQFAPIGIGARSKNEHHVSDPEFNKIGKKVISIYPNLNTVIYNSKKRSGKYVFIGPEGNIFGVDYDGSYKTVANFLNSSKEEIIGGMSSILKNKENNSHAQIT